MNSIDLNSLRVFVKIAQANSITKAAHNLRVPKSKVSRVLMNLEKALGQQLFHRTTREMRLTTAGKKILEKSQPAIEALEQLNTQKSDNILEGLVRVTAPVDIGIRLLPKLIADFRELHPKVYVDVLVSQETIDLVRESVDIAIRFGKLSDSSLKAQKIGSLSLILVASPKFLERQLRLKKIQDIAQLPCLGLSALRQKWILQDGKNKITISIENVVEANDPAVLLELALLEQGIAFLPEPLCRDAIHAGTLQRIFREWQGESMPVHLVHPYKKEMPERVRHFLDFLLEKLSLTL